MTTPRASRPLDGIRVLDLSNYLPGPYATQLLTNLGADVIKIEPPGGDPARHLGGNLFASVNHGKRSMEIDLKSPDGVAAVRALARDADVVVEGFRPGVLDRLGLSYDALAQDNPSLIYCSITGYGQTGEFRHHPGHDISYLAESGVFAVPSQWNSTGPERSGLPVADLLSSLYADIAILARLRLPVTERGGKLDVSMLDGLMDVLSTRLHLTAENPDMRSHLAPSNSIYCCADGRYVALAAVEQHFWEKLVAYLGDDRLFDDRYCDHRARQLNGRLLHEILVEVFLARPAHRWADELQAHGIPASLVKTPAEAVEGLRARGRSSSPAPVLDDIGKFVGAFSEAESPLLDQHRQEITQSGWLTAPAGP